MVNEWVTAAKSLENINSIVIILQNILCNEILLIL